MSKYIIIFYMIIVFGILAIIQTGIRQDGSPHLPRDKTVSGEEGYTPLAKKIEQVARESREAEEKVRKATIGKEFGSMVLIPEGEFIMGSPDGPNDQKPVRRVYLKAYFIDKYEVTFAEYYEFMKMTGHRKPRLAGYLSRGITENIPLFIQATNPVVGVKWYDADEYCRWKSKRLPTEAEWEKAAKGVGQKKWPWGDEERSEWANLIGDDGFPFTAPVNGLPKDVSSYGVHGMAGNVMEWVADWYNQDSYEILPIRNPVGTKVGVHGEQRVIRGASWHDSIKRAQTSVRFKMYPLYRDVTIGFRCAKDS